MAKAARSPVPRAEPILAPRVLPHQVIAHRACCCRRFDRCTSLPPQIALKTITADRQKTFHV
eukprot:7229784-Prymnesium_polylepis.1